MIQYQYWLDNSLLCLSEDKVTYYGNGKPATIRHTAYFCEICGDIWARKIITTVPTPLVINQSWYLEYALCHKHGGGSLTSIWRHQLDTLEQDYPKELLANEFLVLHREYFRT